MVGLSIHLSFNPALLHQAEQLPIINIGATQCRDIPIPEFANKEWIPDEALMGNRFGPGC